MGVGIKLIKDSGEHGVVCTWYPTLPYLLPITYQLPVTTLLLLPINHNQPDYAIMSLYFGVEISFPATMTHPDLTKGCRVRGG